MHQPLNALGDLSDSLRSLYLHWLSAHKREVPPRLSRLNLPLLAEEMNILVVTEILRGPSGCARDFRFLYLGRTIGEALHEDPTGHLLTDYGARGPGSQIWAAYAAIAADPRPHLVQLPYTGPDPAFDRTRELFLPLLDDADAPSFVLAGVELRADPNLGSADRDRASQGTT